MNSKVIYILVAVFGLLVSCKINQKESITLITGKVDINGANTIKLSNGAITLTDSWIDRLNLGDSIIELNSNGTFRIELQIVKPDFYRLSHGFNEVELFISPQDSLYIDFNSGKIVSGTSEILNSHLKSLRDTINSNRRYINGTDFYSQSFTRVNAVLDSLESVYVKIHQEFKDNHTVHDIFEQKIMADITYRSKLCKIAHPGMFKKQTGEKLPVSNSYYDDITKGSFDNSDLLKSLDYVLFINEYVTAQSAGDYKYDTYWEAPIESIHPKYKQIQKLEAHQDIKDYLFADHLNKSMDSYGITYLKDLIPQFNEDCRNPILIKQIENRFQAANQERKEPNEIEIYKTIGNIELEAHIFYPDDFKEGDQRPAYLFFHGGGWSIGTPNWGYKNCKNYSSKGMVAISFEYRLIDIHQSNILDCVRDAKSAILWTRKQAKSLGVDPNKIVAAGFSAGGHLAASTAILKGFDKGNDVGLSSIPNALIVHSASYNTLKNNWFAKQSEQKPKSISTFHQLDKNLVPSIFFHGTNDHLAPISEFKEFKDKMDALGNDYEYKIFENVGHFFNDSKARKTVQQMTEAFLVKLGYIETDS